MRLRTILALAPILTLAACGGHSQGGVPAVSGFDDDGGSEIAAIPAPAGINEPFRLKGLNSGQLKAVLGKPIFTRRDTPAEIWQYRGRACTLDVFLYDDKGGQSVAHYAVRSPQPVNEKDCFSDLTARRQEIPAS